MPLFPFLAADGALLSTALLIAWRTPGEITGGALLAVLLCVALGAVSAVLPWVLNHEREREAALAERQRELADLVNTSMASAARWGTQWASAATGLEDAAQLASRSIAAAERLPGVFEEKAEAWAERRAAAEREAWARVEKAAQQEAAIGARAEQMNAAAEALNRRLAEAEALIVGMAAKLERVATMPEPRVAPAPAAVAQPVVEKPAAAAGSEAIMDPFLIPDDGYASLAEAMDARNV